MVKVSAPFASSYNNSYLRVIKNGQLPMASFELPNLRKLFAASRSEQEESAYSRTAFYNLLFFVTSIAAFSFAAQRLAPAKNMGR
ncbi:uncharacterized protein LAJ45_04448 [Morchella importuna]|uniref:uncharacterized protein n=1 Tax=Morchella importuna TaxID=1174673 RepID=UPI001E8EB8E8|nr:uncharacterized protein LAJ45_04448 [Morchella importuna]KAH8151246.1 hypothetical protein LAJ45_04448 [Morchella importuna]